MRSFLFITLLLTLISSASTSITPQDKSCREHPKLVGACFKVHGRLTVYNGAPALRLFRLGTKRVLGISEQRFALAGYKNVPDEIKEKIDQDHDLIGDYVVCPFTRERRGEMQLVCIESVANLQVKH
ncbi:MAG TPA: hypothetical protein VI306_22045 [Pyrinomonadaceae bacterium]